MEKPVPCSVPGRALPRACPSEPDRPQPAQPQPVPSVFLTELEEPAFPEDGAVPPFLLPFQDAEWFKQVCHHLRSMGFPPDLSVSEVVRRLLEALPAAGYAAKTDIVSAVLALRERLGAEDGGEVHAALLAALNPSDPPTLQAQRKFVLAALRALLAFSRDNKELLVELMACFLQTPITRRDPLKDLFLELGLQDPRSYFYVEMDSWDFSAEKEVTKAVLRRRCAQWLEGAMQSFQDHQRRGLDLEEALPGRKHILGSSPKAKKAAAWCKALPSASSLAASAQPIDAVNHFCRMQLRRSLERLKPAGMQDVTNAVVALPSLGKSQAILRLGETNTLARRRSLQRFYLPRIIPRPLLKGFVHAIRLPLPKITLSPFPYDLDTPASQEAFVAVHQKVQKYFIPKFSLADSYP